MITKQKIILGTVLATFQIIILIALVFAFIPTASALPVELMGTTAKCLHNAQTQADRNECMWAKAQAKKD